MMSTHRDTVHALPGWDGPLPSANYSGFIEVARDGKMANWHYTLSEAEAPVQPEAAPLVLYVSGGPGGSSFQTSFRGFGQFRLDERSVAGEAFERTGVGFSFCPDPADAVWDDDTVAVHSADFLAGVVDRHPTYRGRTLIVFGASYAGIYIPMLAREILARGSGYPLRLSAIGVGNAAIGHFPGWNFPNAGQLLTSHDVPCDTASHVDFYFASGLFSQSLYAKIQDQCGGDRSMLDFPSSELKDLLGQMQREMGPLDGRDNIYSLEGMADNTNGTGMGYPAGSNAAFEKWVALPSVRAALNVSLTFPDSLKWGGSDWKYPFNNDIGWLDSGQPDPAVGGKPLDLRPLYAELAQSLRVIVYNGDVDGQVPAQGCERWVESLGLPKRFEGWRPWTVGGKVAGGVIEYQVPPSRVSNYNGIEYATVHGAGHGVPQHRPQFALEMLRAAIDERELPRSRDDLEARL